MYRNFRAELRKLRRTIENSDADAESTFEIPEEYTGSSEFYKQVIAYRIDEYFRGKTPTKKELLKLLSLWEIDL